MAEELSIESLRAAIRGSAPVAAGDEDARFEALARRYEGAVAHLIGEIRKLVEQVPELAVALEDEVETFTSPAFPGKQIQIRDQRLRISHGDDFLLFDPTASALMGALGQVEVEASRPISFMVEQVLYLVTDRTSGGARWGYRSATGLGGPPEPFTRAALMRMLHAVFASR